MEEQYRHEMKYICTIQELTIIQSRLNKLLLIDENAVKDGKYNIRSMYFDDYDNTCFFENESGTDPREKFRIRIYNQNSDRITLECKRKERGKTIKKSCILTKEECNELIQGRTLPITGSAPKLVNKLSLLMQTRLMKPVIIVEYSRTPYVCPDGNVRITLDTNIESSVQINEFFSFDIAKRPILPAGYHILEVKYDEFLPDFISNSLQLGTLKHSAFSKYYLCRKFHL